MNSILLVYRYHVIWPIITQILGVSSNPDEHFLESIIGRLQRERPVDNDRLLYDQFFATSRSASYNPEEYDMRGEILHRPENPFFQQNYNVNQDLDEIESLQQQPQQQQEEQQLDYQYHLNSALLALQQAQLSYDAGQPLAPYAYHLSVGPLAPQESEQNSEPTTPFPLLNTGPNLFQPNNNPVQPQIPQQPSDIDNQQGGAPAANANLNSLMAHNNALLPPSQELPQPDQQFVPVYYFYNTPAPVDNNVVDDNLIDNTLNAMRPFGVPGQEDNYIMGGDQTKKFTVEPLFVAMAGFVGIAVIFMSAVLFLPKIFTPPPDVTILKGPAELTALTKLAVQAIEGNDCTERIACEVGRAMRGLSVGSQPIKVLEVLLPANMAQQLAQIRKAVADKRVCKLIRCKPAKINNNKLKTLPATKKQSKTEDQIIFKSIEKIQSKKPTEKEHELLLEPRVDWEKHKRLEKVEQTTMAAQQAKTPLNEVNNMVKPTSNSTS